ncbi:MAG: AraC family transcriptional regulator [Deltaproteobacteria bacterium]|nr:MAG: AraC family transcriptional regulator [Deltaproteobacteria bacterium]
MLMLGVVRLGGDGTWRPAEVHLQTGESAVPRDAEPLAAAHLRFGQPATAITLPRALLDEPLPQPGCDLQTPRESVDTWRASAPARDFVASIVQAVEMLSWEGYPDIHLTAEFLGMNVRTLQRYLAAAGVTHELLVGRARFATAAGVLEETDTKILDIALDLGYSDHAHFTRAFRRWAGCAPREYRRRRRQKPAPPSQPVSSSAIQPARNGTTRLASTRLQGGASRWLRLIRLVVPEGALVRHVPEDRLELGLGHHDVNRPRHEPLESKADGIERVSSEPQRIRFGVIVRVVSTRSDGHRHQPEQHHRSDELCHSRPPGLSTPS